MATNQLDAGNLGQLASTYAPDVPLEILGAVFETESSYGSAPGAYQPNSSGAIGPGQILSRALGAKYGNFEAYMPDGDPLNPEHATIAALKKISADWNRAGGDIERFAPLYFGAGKDKSGNTAANHYVPKLLAAIQGQSSDANYWDFVNGAMGNSGQMDTGTPSDTLSEARTSYRLANGTPRAPAYEPVKLDQESTYTTAATSVAQQLIDKIAAGQTEQANAKTGVEAAEASTKIELAKQTESMLSAFGLNLNDSNSQVSLTAQALQQGMAKLRADQESVNKVSANPLFNVLDTVTGGSLSLTQRKALAQSQDTVKNLTASLAQIQTVAQQQIALQPNVSESAVEKEIQAKSRANLANADVAANKLGLQQEVRNIGLENRLQIQEAKNALAQQRIDISMAMKDISAARATLPKQLTFSQRMQEANQLADEEMFLNTSKAMGFNDPAEYVRFLAGNKKLTGYMVGADGRLPLPLVAAKKNLGKLTPAQNKMFDAAYGQFNGWAAPTSANANSVPGINYLPDGIDELMKTGGKSEVERDAIRQGIVLSIAEKKRDFILNRGNGKDEEANPYAANFARVGQFAKLPEFTKANPIVDRVSKSILYTTIATKNASNSFDKQGVGDEEVLKEANALVAGKQLSPQQAAIQVSEYFQAQIAMNNYAKEFKNLGLPDQEAYRVPVAEGKTLTIEFKEKTGDKGVKTPDYQMMDLSNETKVLSLILSAGRPLYMRNGILKFIADVTTGTDVSKLPTGENK
jgi:hypothetical protein